MFLRHLLAFYQSNPVTPGSVDLFALGPDDTWGRMGEFGALLCLAGHPDAPLAQVRVVWPGPVTPELKAAIVTHAGDTLRSLGIEAQAGETILSRLEVEPTTSLEAKTLLDLVEHERPRTAFVVAHAARYRSGDVQPALPLVALKEDTWVPHLNALMHALGPVASSADSYVVLDAGEDLPTRPENRELLRSVPQSAVFGTERPIDDEKRVLYERLVELTTSGNIGQALEELDASAWFDSMQRLLARLQLLRRAGQNLAVAAELLSAREQFRELTPEVQVALAMHAEFAGVREIAVELLDQALPELESREDLEQALATASGTGDEELIARVEAVLSDCFPSSPILLRRLALTQALQGEFAQAAETARSTAAVSDELRTYWGWLGGNLQTATSVDPQILRQDADRRFPQFVDETIGHIVDHLLRTGGEVSALLLLLGDGNTSSAFSRKEASAALRVLHQIALVHGPEGVPSDIVAIALEKVIRTLADNPGDSRLRAEVVDTLAPEVFGRTGIAVAAYLLLVLSTPAIGPLPNKPHLIRYLPVAENTGLKASIESAFEWMARTPRFILGTRTLPAEMLSIPADDFLAAIGRVVSVLLSELASDDDKAALHEWLGLAVAIAPLAVNSDEDLVLLRVAVSQFAASGLRQDARDFSEQVLILARQDPGRARMAWTIYAEAYGRGGNLTEALVGMACALAVQPAGSWEESWLDNILIARLMRDLNLVELAEPFLAAARTALAHIPDDNGALASRLNTMDLFLTLAKRSGDDAWRREHLASFLDRVADNLRSVLALDDEAAPAASLLANAMHIARLQGVPIPPSAEQALGGALQRLDPALRNLISAAAGRAPSAGELLALAQRTQTARYHGDVGFDEERLAAMARRFLATKEAGTDPSLAAYAIEATADHSVAPPGTRGSFDGTGPRITALETGPADAACEISRGGIAVVLLADSDAGLRRVVAAEGELQAVVTEPSDVFDLRRLMVWLKDYPIGYRRDDADANTFYLSTERLGLSEIPDRAVVIADTHLQVFPPGLLRVGDEPAGRTARVAAAPSLEWLLASRRMNTVLTPTRTAWIPHDPEAPESLGHLADRLGPDLEVHGFELATSIEPPQHQGRAELAIVVGHGGVADENRYFRVVKDDAGAAVSPGTLAAAFGDTAVVVLFVCSGGRVDVRPGANAVVGMVSQLLGSGCSAVVAPPWPLETMVPPRWLPPFLDAMDRGATVLDACFEANEAVRRLLGEEPRRWLAMSVYGDPYTALIARAED